MTQENTAEAVSLNDVFDQEDQELETVESPEISDDAPINQMEAKDEQTTEAETVEEVLEALEAPEFFRKEHKDLFSKLQELEGGRDYAQGWLDQYTEGQSHINQKQQEFAERKRDLETLQHYNQAISPLMEHWQRNAVHPAMGLAQMAHYGNMLYTDPQALIQEVAQFGGIDLNKLVEDQPYVSETERSLQQKVQQLEQTIGQFQQGQQSQSAQAIQNEITTFTNATDPDGNPLHPHIETVGQEMAMLLQMPNNGVNDLKTAYETAVSLNPQIQEEIRKEKQAEEAAKRQAEAEKAKEASTRTNSKTKDAPRVKKKLTNIFDDDLEGDD